MGAPAYSPARTRIALQIRILRNIKIDADGCWIWQGRKSKTSGYGRINIRIRRFGVSVHKSVSVHRLSHELWIGPIPRGKVVDHECQKKLCCRPECVKAMSQSENMKKWHHRRNNGKKTLSFVSENYPQDSGVLLEE